MFEQLLLPKKLFFTQDPNVQPRLTWGCSARDCTVDVVRMDLRAHLFIPLLQVPLEARAEGVHCSSEFSHTSRGLDFR